MEGAALAEHKRIDLAILTSWHTAMFGLSGYAGKLKGKKLSDYLSGAVSEGGSAGPFQAISFFHRMKAAGFPVKIERVVH